jgi:hypothetical protein
MNKPVLYFEETQYCSHDAMKPFVHAETIHLPVEASCDFYFPRCASLIRASAISTDRLSRDISKRLFQAENQGLRLGKDITGHEKEEYWYKSSL